MSQSSPWPTSWRGSPGRCCSAGKRLTPMRYPWPPRDSFGRSESAGRASGVCERVKTRWPDSQSALRKPGVENGARRRRVYEDRGARISLLAGRSPPRPDTLKQPDQPPTSTKPLADGAGHTFSTSGNGAGAFLRMPIRSAKMWKRRPDMDYFAGLDISMDETHVCVLDREGVVVRESTAALTAEAIAGELAKAPSCRRIVFETGRMAPILFHGLNQLGLPVVCVESRQAYQALKSLATHKTDRNDARGLAHLARTGFFKPVHVKSLRAHALRSLISARKKLVGQRVTLENQIRGLAVVFGVRLPRALTTAFIDQALKASEGVAGLSVAMRGLIAARTAVMTAVAAIDADMRRMTRASAACRRLMTIPGVGQLTALAFVAAIDDPSRIRRSRDIGAYLGLVPKRYQS